MLYEHNMSGNIQAKVQKVLDAHADDSMYYVHLSHDGFDRDCYPESFLYDLFVWDNNTVWFYHYENWFHPGDAEAEFSLYRHEDSIYFFDPDCPDHSNINIYNLTQNDFRNV